MSEKRAVVAFGRMNPPTTGHEKLIHATHKEAKSQGASAHVIASHSQDKKKNPVPQDKKLSYLKKVAPKGVHVTGSSKEAPSLLHHASRLHAQGHKHLTVMAAGEREGQFHKLLHQYNGKKGPHGHYNFKSITIKSSGKRDPKASGVEGVSGTKMRAHAKSGDHKSFKAGLPKALHPHAKEIMGHINEEAKPDKDTPWTGTIKSKKDVKENVPVEFHTDAVAGAELVKRATRNIKKKDAMKKEGVDFEQEVDEALNYKQRIARRLIMRRNRPKLIRAKKMMSRRKAPEKNIQQRAQKAAIRLIRKRVAGTKGMQYNKATAQEKEMIDRRVAKKQAIVTKIARRMLPVMRKAELVRLSSRRSKANESFEEFDALIEGGLWDNRAQEAVDPVQNAKTRIKSEKDRNADRHDDLMDRARLRKARMKNAATEQVEEGVVGGTIGGAIGGASGVGVGTGYAIGSHVGDHALKYAGGAAAAYVARKAYKKIQKSRDKRTLKKVIKSYRADEKAKKQAPKPMQQHQDAHEGKIQQEIDERNFTMKAPNIDFKQGMAKKTKKLANKDNPTKAAGTKHEYKKDTAAGKQQNTIEQQVKEFVDSIMTGDWVLSEKVIKSLTEKADKSDVPYSIIKKVFDKGMDEWDQDVSESSQQQFAFHTVNTFLAHVKEEAQGTTPESKLEWGTDEATNHAKSMTPGEEPEQINQMFENYVSAGSGAMSATPSRGKTFFQGYNDRKNKGIKSKPIDKAKFFGKKKDVKEEDEGHHATVHYEKGHFGAMERKQVKIPLKKVDTEKGFSRTPESTAKEVSSHPIHKQHKADGWRQSKMSYPNKAKHYSRDGKMFTRYEHAELTGEELEEVMSNTYTTSGASNSPMQGVQVAHNKRMVKRFKQANPDLIINPSSKTNKLKSKGKK